MIHTGSIHVSINYDDGYMIWKVTQCNDGNVHQLRFYKTAVM